MSHPYPTAADLARERAAEARDAADLLALRALRRIVERAIADAEMVAELRHPWAKWGVGDLLEILRGELVNIDGADELIGRETVLEDA